MAAIEIKWKKMGPEFTYHVMYSKDPDGPWIKANEYRIVDGINNSISSFYSDEEYNLFIIDGLRNDEIYYVQVLSHDKDHQWWYSYDGIGSLGGGLRSDSRPSPNDGNTLGIQFEVI